MYKERNTSSFTQLIIKNVYLNMFLGQDCMIASLQLIVPAVKKYKFIIKAFIGKAFNNIVQTIWHVQFKVRDRDKNGKSRWTWLGLITRQQNLKQVKPDKRFPGLQFTAPLLEKNNNPKSK